MAALWKRTMLPERTFFSTRFVISSAEMPFQSRLSRSHIAETNGDAALNGAATPHKFPKSAVEETKRPCYNFFAGFEQCAALFRRIEPPQQPELRITI